MKSVDVLVIGSGAGGSAVAFYLAVRAGIEVLVLEKGPNYEPEDFPDDEVGNVWRSTFVPPLHEDPHILVHPKLAGPRPMPVGWSASCVGGGTMHMGGYLSRFHPADFRMRSTFGNYHDIEDWPYSYEELEPFYTMAEWEVGVSGVAGANPFEGARSAGYPLPPLESLPLTSHVEDACRRLGLHPFLAPKAINSIPYQGRPACVYCQHCSGFGCRVGARGSAKEALLDRAVASGHCEVRSEAMVRKITTDCHGKPDGCVYIDREGREQRIRARVICLACSAVESARLLLMSKSAKHPDGLANEHGLVGKHLQFHCASQGSGVFEVAEHPDLDFSLQGGFLGTNLMDHYFLPEGLAPLPKGGAFLFHYNSSAPIISAKMAARVKEPMLWGQALKKRLKSFYSDERKIVHFEVHHDFIPNSGTYVELDPDVRDRWGLPVARIHIEDPEHHQIAGSWLADRGLEVLHEMGAQKLSKPPSGETAFFLIEGTCRAGSDPEKSVLNGYCQAHALPNLFVTDASFMPTSGGNPPTLTIIANSFRAADFMARETWA